MAGKDQVRVADAVPVGLENVISGGVLSLVPGDFGEVVPAGHLVEPETVELREHGNRDNVQICSRRMDSGGILTEDLKHQVASAGRETAQGNLMAEVADDPHTPRTLDVAGSHNVPGRVEDPPQHRRFEPCPEAGDREVPANDVVRFGLADLNKSRRHFIPPKAQLFRP